MAKDKAASVTPASSKLEDLLQRLNDGESLSDLKTDLVKLAKFANDHPEISLAGSIRTNLNSFILETEN